MDRGRGRAIPQYRGCTPGKGKGSVGRDGGDGERVADSPYIHTALQVGTVWDGRGLVSCTLRRRRTLGTVLRVLAPVPPRVEET